jgi:hypothetical protein
MGGKSIPGPHWVEVDLGRQCVVEKAVIDWEDGYSNTWTLKVFNHLKYRIFISFNDSTRHDVE